MTLNEDQKIRLHTILSTILKNEQTEVVFTKANGDVRVLRCTQSMDIIPEEHRPIQKPVSESTENKPKEVNYNNVRAFDLEANSWRSFNVDKLISVNGLKIEQLVKVV